MTTPLPKSQSVPAAPAKMPQDAVRGQMRSVFTEPSPHGHGDRGKLPIQDHPANHNAPSSKYGTPFYASERLGGTFMPPRASDAANRLLYAAANRLMVPRLRTHP